MDTPTWSRIEGGAAFSAGASALSPVPGFFQIFSHAGHRHHIMKLLGILRRQVPCNSFISTRFIPVSFEVHLFLRSLCHSSLHARTIICQHHCRHHHHHTVHTAHITHPSSIAFASASSCPCILVSVSIFSLIASESATIPTSSFVIIISFFHPFSYFSRSSFVHFIGINVSFVVHRLLARFPPSHRTGAPTSQLARAPHDDVHE